MGNVTLKKFIEDFKNLPIEEKEYALEIVKKQIRSQSAILTQNSF